MAKICIRYLVRILNWCQVAPNKIWVPLEKSMAGRNLEGAPWVLSGCRGFSDWTSPLTLNTVWDRLNVSGQYATKTSSLTPLGGFPWFSLGKDIGFFHSWGTNGNTACAKFAAGVNFYPLLRCNPPMGTSP